MAKRDKVTEDAINLGNFRREAKKFPNIVNQIALKTQTRLILWDLFCYFPIGAGILENEKSDYMSLTWEAKRKVLHLPWNMSTSDQDFLLIYGICRLQLSTKEERQNDWKFEDYTPRMKMLIACYLHMLDLDYEEGLKKMGLIYKDNLKELFAENSLSPYKMVEEGILFDNLVPTRKLTM